MPRFYIQLDCSEAQKKHLISHARMIRIKALDLDILFKPEDYVDGDMERGHLNKRGWDKLFNKGTNRVPHCNTCKKVLEDCGCDNFQGSHLA